MNQRAKRITFSITFAAIGIGIFSFLWLPDNQISHNAWAGPINISALSIDAATAKVNASTASLFATPFTFTVGDTSTSTTLESLGVTFDQKTFAQKALAFGRTGPWYMQTFDRFSSLFFRHSFPIPYLINTQQLESSLAVLFPSDEQPAQNAALIYSQDSNSFSIVPESFGHIINPASLHNALTQDLLDLRAHAIASEVISDSPQVTTSGVAQAQQQAQEIMQKMPYLLVLSDSELFPLDPATTASFLQFTPDSSGINLLNLSANTSTITTFLNTVGTGFNRPVVNAALTLDANNRVTTFHLPQEGRTLIMDQSIQSIAQGIIGGEKEIHLTFAYQQPLINEDSIQKYGLTSELGEGSSNFYGSSASRIFNITLGASKYNGLLVAPGEEFSFDKVLGDVDKEHGWKSELVIKNGSTVPDYGGGLCQVSTTLFRAAVYAGLKITERYPHAFPVRYYDPQGFDATIYPPSPDLKFVNNTKNYILIQSHIEGNNLYFQIFGTRDGRITTVDGPYVYDKKSDGSMKAKLTQTVWQDGKIIEQQTFYSNYQSPYLYPVQRNPLE